MKRSWNTGLDELFLDDVYEHRDTSHNKEILAIMLKDMMNKEGKIAPDTVGVDYYFIEDFLTPEMMWDFPLIEREFLQHCYEKIKDFEVQSWYGGDSIHNNGLQVSVMKRILTYIYNGAKSGDAYCNSLIRYLYKLYHKKEYSQLKRFHSITVSEVMSLAENEYGNPTFAKMGRILGMCDILGITMDEKCSVLYLLLERERENTLNEEDKYLDDTNWGQSLFDECMEQIEQWCSGFEEKDLRGWYSEYREEEKFIEACLNYMGYPEDYTYICNERYRGLKAQMACTLELLKRKNPGKEFSYREVQHFAQIYGLVETIAELSDSFEEELIHFFEAEEYEVGAMFKPENVSIQSTPMKKSVQKRTTNVAPVVQKDAKAEDYMQEISDLRRRLAMQEQENRHLREQYRSVKTADAEKEKILSAYQREREELVALRDFAYRSTREYEELSEETLSNMQASIADKAIVVIGGHVNWINKMSKIFKNWMFIQPDAYKTVDGRMLEHKERVYFFTDYLNHISYNKFISAVRERRIPFGYLHSRNLEYIVRQVYEDLER